MKKLHIKKDDTVKVIAGNHKGRTAKVLEVLPEKNKAIVEGINMVTKHVKPSAQNPEGGRSEQEAPIHVSKLMVVDPSNGEPSRIGRKKNDQGKLQRYSKKTGEFI
ncbi:50S ribosomal protein L24 [Porifericola rhodea]|uniref:50S ribosomal protein L24 n=1 Tax=Porifericola rhodea TaxID=930972 RepID=UPI0026670908|nr:50S ribosomal protein L24 [Porifericola rhodea]WKN32004.1 50S ribosomal protein L24 [Porifericola rhodea]